MSDPAEQLGATEQLVAYLAEESIGYGAAYQRARAHDAEDAAIASNLRAWQEGAQSLQNENRALRATLRTSREALRPLQGTADADAAIAAADAVLGEDDHE